MKRRELEERELEEKEGEKKEYHVWFNPGARNRLYILAAYDGTLCKVLPRAEAVTRFMDKNRIDFVRLGKYEHQVTNGYLQPFDSTFDIKFFKKLSFLSRLILEICNYEGFRANFSDRLIELMQKVDSDLSMGVRRALWNYWTIRDDMAKNINQSVTFFSGKEEIQISLPPIERRYVGR